MASDDDYHNSWGALLGQNQSQQERHAAASDTNAMRQQQMAQNSFGGFFQCSTTAGNPYPGMMQNVQSVSDSSTPQPKKEKGMFSEIAADIKKFILEYRGVLYFLAGALLVDELIFKGAFRHRLQGLADKLIAKVEAKVA